MNFALELFLKSFAMILVIVIIGASISKIIHLFTGEK